MADLILQFTLDQETKTTVRFKELDKDGKDAENPVMGKVYVKKTQLSKWKDPKNLEVEVRPKK